MKALTVIIALAVINTGCSDRVSLQGGYEMVRLDSANRVIVDANSEFVVYPDIRSCRRVDNYVVGTRREETKYPMVDPGDVSSEHKLGNFILNLNNGELRTGVDIQEVQTIIELAESDSNCMPRAFWTSVSFGLFK